MDHIKIGPFVIKEIKKPLDYELNLPTNAKIFFMFNIFLLKSTDSKTPLATNFRYHIRKIEYKIEKKNSTKWSTIFHQMKNCDEKEDIWEPIKKFGNCKIFLPQFHQTKRTNFPSQQKKQIIRTRH